MRILLHLSPPVLMSECWPIYKMYMNSAQRGCVIMKIQQTFDPVLVSKSAVIAQIM